MTNTGHDTSTGELPEGWLLRPVGGLPLDLFVDGDWVESKDQDPDGPVRLTQLADVGEGWFRDRSDRWLRTDQAERLGVTRLQKGDLLVARMPDPLGRCCMVPDLPQEAVTVVDVAILRFSEQAIVPSFVMWMLNSPEIRSRMAELASGTTRKRISRKNLATVELPVPPLGEQVRIVELLEAQLSRLDAALGHVHTVRDKAAQFRRSLLHAAFTGALTGHDTSTGQHPDGWRDGVLGDLVVLKSGFAYKSKDWEESGVPVIKIANVRDGQVNLTGCSFVGAGLADETSQFAVVKGDLLMTLTGEIGATGIYRDHDPARLNQRVARLDLRTGADISMEFLVLLLQSPTVRDPLWDLAQGMAQPNISPKRVVELPVTLPAPAEQDRIIKLLEAQLSRLDAALVVAGEVEERALALRRSLLHAAFTGKLTEKWREENDV
jgi:type I restriction enzyme, S subunit